ncbi:hypothetical protein [Carboxylicivirga linearis]|uniref:Adhesin domain-containing protein n=1 Tax=Carboxylicivirga linearis TaxID=1628157 RepID=A0ABS5K0B6_9BACT|nr:hypothetical protein [Carboxylicivirga linearis]MBS2100520.1 hypothetical protein [Carboxylicivirga linearis]
MMKQLYRTITFCILILLSFKTITNAQDKYATTGNGYGVREILEFDASDYNMLKITNQHGNITIKGWDRDTIEVQSLINVEAPGSNSAEEVLDYISIERANRAGMLIFRTQFDDEFFSNYPFSVEYTVHLPKQLMLDITNNLGDVLIQNIDGKISLHLDYGNLHLINSNSKKAHTFNLNFAEAKLDSCQSVKGFLNNCTLTADNVTKLDFKSEYSLLKLGKTKSIALHSSTDRINITESDSIKITGNQLLVNIKKVNTYGFFEIEKGQLMIKGANQLAHLSVSNKMANTIISLPSEYTYVLNGEITNGELNHPNINQLQVLREGTKESFTGHIGTEGNTTGQLILFNENSDLTIKTY